MAKQRVAILVPNACDPDYRVIKQAEVLAAAGYDVRVFAVRKGQTEATELFNGVTYVRKPWNILKGLFAYILGGYRVDGELFEQHEANKKEYRRLMARRRRKRADQTPADAAVTDSGASTKSETREEN